MLYIIRHSKTDWNLVHKLQGNTDIPLNELGREMARSAALEYSEVHFDACYCSPLSRARETAEILLYGRNIPIITDERLREMSFGIYEGSERNYENPSSPMYTLFKSPDKYHAVTGGESFEQLFARTGDFLKEVVEPAVKQGKDILIVGHGAMNSAIICQIKNLPIEKFWSFGIESCKLMRLL